MKEIFSGKGAVGAFNVIQIEHAEALTQASVMTKLPIILQISQNAVKYHGSLKPISVATRAIIEESGAQAYLHLDHAEDMNLVRAALDLGFDSVMYDGSKLDYAENVKTSLQMAELAHKQGALIELELGEVGGKDGVHAAGARTNPEEAKQFIAETNADLLAVAVGSSHAMTTRDAKLDFELIKDLNKTVPVPLVLHGSSGVSDLDIQEAIRSGMRKVNIATHLNNVFTASVRETLAADPKLVDTRKYIKPAREAVANETARLLQLLNLEGAN
jgi:fructose-bisphosphate aldolase class II